jgi:hypothetical protein
MMGRARAQDRHWHSTVVPVSIGTCRYYRFVPGISIGISCADLSCSPSGHGYTYSCYSLEHFCLLEATGSLGQRPTSMVNARAPSR